MLLPAVSLGKSGMSSSVSLCVLTHAASLQSFLCVLILTLSLREWESLERQTCLSPGVVGS